MAPLMGSFLVRVCPSPSILVISFFRETIIFIWLFFYGFFHVHREAAQSDNDTMRYLVDLLVILKRNLVKAEAEVCRSNE